MVFLISFLVAFANLVDASFQTEEVQSNTNSLEMQLSELQEELKNEREKVASLKTLNNQVNEFFFS
jgi:predicted transcriptional regulator